jgi:hypothetical protein
MNRLILPLCALALLAGACSSTQSAKKAPIPAKNAGTVDTHWGNLPRYTTDQQVAFLDFNPKGIPFFPKSYRVEVDLLVERDGSVRDVAVRRTSGAPAVDDVVVTHFKQSRSRLLLSPTDPAPYVIQCAFNNNVVADNSLSGSAYWVYPLTGNQYPMGQGQPTPRERGY